MPMPPRRKKGWGGFSVPVGFDLFTLARNVSRPPSPRPNVPATLVNPPPSDRPVDVKSQMNPSITVGATHREQQASSSQPTLTLTRTSGDVTSLPQKGSEYDPEWAPTRPASPHTDLVASNTAVVAPITLAPGVEEDGWARLKSLHWIINQSASLFGPLKAAVDELVACIEIYERVAHNRDDFRELQAKLEELFRDLQTHFSHGMPSMVTASMESLCKSIVKELGYVKEKQNRGTIRRYLEAGGDADKVFACYRRIQGHLYRLLLNANLSMWKIADEQATNNLLDRLGPSLSACYNSKQATELQRGACTAGTRTDVLAQMYSWVRDRAAGQVYWLDGMAGTGKTTIAYSLCEELDAAHNLGASFFCSRSRLECRDVDQIVPTIAYQLAHFSRPFRCALSRVLERERNVHTQLLHIQFEALVVKPLNEVRNTLPEDLVVVIDALDECDNKKSTGEILEALLTKTSNLPIKFFMSSRPAPEIRDRLMQQDSRQTISRLVLHELDKGTVQSDIKTYLRVALGRISPSETQIATLVQRAGSLFIYAATVVRYIGYDNFGRNPNSRLGDILNISTSAENHTYQEIDDLYAVILAEAIGDPKLTTQERNDMKQVLNTVLCAREPLTIAAISGLLGLHDIDRVHAALRPLWSVLHIVESSGLVTTLHASFLDYMFDPKRSKDYFCDKAMLNHTLARRCFSRIMETQPQFNICRLKSSYVPDDQIADLGGRIEMAILPDLSYACRYWATHLECTKESEDLVGLLEDFLGTRLLLWMEIMNLKRCMGDGVEMMRQAEDWCMHQVGPEPLTHLAHDAWRFVTAFTSSPVSQSTPHIYVSMLPFWPESSPISKHYSKRTQMPMVPQGSAVARQLGHPELLAMWSLDKSVDRVAWSPDGTRIVLVVGGGIFLQDATTGRLLMGPLQPKSGSAQSIELSPDGTRIVAGSADGTIELWDAQSGQVILGPLAGHTESVKSVAFSPDGGRIVSGSRDKTIRIWDAQKGQTVLGPLEGHTREVTSVAFSPDGTCIVAGSYNKTVCMWDARSGQMLFGPLEGHTELVASVAFSPDGARIVSGSWDKTIRIWDARSGQLVLGPLEGHTEWVRSVAFSPDGSCIISGSDDKTICMWDARNGQLVLGPLKGHTRPVTSVAFSPDNTRIISGSWDKTIRMWDARSKPTVLDPLEGHVHRVRAVTFSPDGTRIISGSDDSTIRMWEAQTGRSLLAPLEGHTAPVTSVAFSPDGTRIISGSDDQTIRMWDASSAMMVLGPLKGHAKSVISVSLSPDGSCIASGSDDYTVRMWNARSGKSVLGPLEGHTHRVRSVAFSPDGNHIVSGSEDGTIRLWDVQSGQKILDPLKANTGFVTSVAFSPDGTLIVSGSRDTTIRMWDARNGLTVLKPLKGHTQPVTYVALSPDGTRIVSASDDLTIRMWDVQSGQPILGPLKGHTKSVTSVAFSPDGTRVVSGSSDNTVRVWDARTEQKVVLPSGQSFAVPSSWNMGSDGWVTDRDIKSRLLAWVPSHLRPFLLPPRNILSFSAAETVGLNFADGRIGESWDECYHPV